MWLLLIGLLCLLLRSLEEEYPLFHLQNSGIAPNYAYYLCYRYPRPEWYVRQVLEQAIRALGEQDQTDV